MFPKKCQNTKLLHFKQQTLSVKEKIMARLDIQDVLLLRTRKETKMRGLNAKTGGNCLLLTNLSRLSEGMATAPTLNDNIIFIFLKYTSVSCDTGGGYCCFTN